MISSILSVTSLKHKLRYDSSADQYTRFFMPKLFTVCAVIMTWSYFNDKITCIISDRAEVPADFVHSTCWISGFYIYDNTIPAEKSAYYGIPTNLDYDGMDEKGRLCTVVDRAGDAIEDCFPMNKRLFLQYQWLPFYIASLSALYYVPYIFFKIVNSDILSLINSARDSHKNAEKIANGFFNYDINSRLKIKLLVFANVLVKFAYIGTNLSGFLLTNIVLEGRFRDFGLNWIKWYYGRREQGNKRDYIGRPGEYILPSMGLCELHVAIRDIRSTVINKHKFICEISQDIMYQYVLAIIWFFFAIGIVASALSFVQLIVKYIYVMISMFRTKSIKEPMMSRDLYSVLTLREIEYLQCLKDVNMSLYCEVLKELTRTRPDLFALKKYFNSTVCRQQYLPEQV